MVTVRQNRGGRNVNSSFAHSNSRSSMLDAPGALHVRNGAAVGGPSRSMASGMPPMAPGTASSIDAAMAAGATGTGAASVEAEYIENLQQQMYFMELELKLLHERERTGKLKRLSEDETAMTAPLEEHMHTLKKKYVAMDRKYKAKIDELLLKAEEDEQINKAQQHSIRLLQETSAEAQALYVDML